MSRALESVIMGIKSLLQNDGAHSSSLRLGGQYLFLRGCGIKGVRDPKCFVPSESSLSNQVRSDFVCAHQRIPCRNLWAWSMVVSSKQMSVSEDV